MEASSAGENDVSSPEDIAIERVSDFSGTSEEFQDSVIGEHSRSGKVAHLHVLGLGCTQRSAEAERTYVLEEVDQPAGTDYFVVCNPALGHMIGGIFRACALRRPNSQPKFVRHVYDKVRDFLTTYDRVVLTGLSYGGMTVVLVSQLLNEEERKRVDCATYGSIYVPPPTPGIRIVHYMFLDDIALKCNQLREPNMLGRVTRAGNIVWIDPYSKFNLQKMGRWEIHNSYGFVIDEVLSTGDVDAFNVGAKEAQTGGAVRAFANAALLAVLVASALWQAF